MHLVNWRHALCRRLGAQVERAGYDGGLVSGELAALWWLEVQTEGAEAQR